MLLLTQKVQHINMSRWWYAPLKLFCEQSVNTEKKNNKHTVVVLITTNCCTCVQLRVIDMNHTSSLVWKLFSSLITAMEYQMSHLCWLHLSLSYSQVCILPLISKYENVIFYHQLCCPYGPWELGYHQLCYQLQKVHITHPNCIFLYYFIHLFCFLHCRLQQKLFIAFIE